MVDRAPAAVGELSRVTPPRLTRADGALVRLLGPARPSQFVRLARAVHALAETSSDSTMVAARRADRLSRPRCGFGRPRSPQVELGSVLA